MKKISLTRGEFALIDDEDFEYLNQFKWMCQVHKTKYRILKYAARCLPAPGGIDRKKIQMHREVLKTTLHIDHRDGDGLNNQKENLRPCTHKQNAQNRRKKLNTTSKYKGVCLNKVKKKNGDGYYEYWVASSFRLFIGTFKTEIEAAKAYDKYAKETYGEFAKLNFKSE